ncbi:MAG: hypothetical protein ACTSUK_02650 [Promethearchaeota archaeon]
MKLLIIETVPKSKNPIDAHVRNAYKIAEGLRARGHKVDILHTNEKTKYLANDYEIILVSYATPYPSFDDIDSFLDRNSKARLGWITNEYNLRPNGCFYKHFKKRGAFILANYEQGAVKFACFDSFHMVNLNTLLFRDLKSTPKKYDHIYYGTFRIDRKEYFKKYLQAPVFLSTSPKNYKKFKHIGCEPKFIKKINWSKPLLNSFRYSLYIEDEFTHDNFNNLANRFYECLGADTVILFDSNCIKTLEKSGIKNYKSFIINNHEDLKKFNEFNYKACLNIQKEWKEQVIIQMGETIEQIEDVLLSEI